MLVQSDVLIYICGRCDEKQMLTDQKMTYVKIAGGCGQQRIPTNQTATNKDRITYFCFVLLLFVDINSKSFKNTIFLELRLPIY